ncbi:MAG TPA: MFS transporter [Verrucomicrobiae bacterium]|nr:MFS transporter [Verrucomicrobiae bacterium]
MNSPGSKSLSTVQWLIIIIAVIGFAFDTYELLMLPVIAGPALSEILQVPANNPLVTEWVGNMLWMTALCGGIFGLLGGWLTDRLGRKTVLAGSIMLYSFSPVFASFSTTLGWFLFFRCTTFIGVCVEFVAAITWLAEMFPDKRQKEIVLGSTQAFASVGGLLVTTANILTVKYASILPALPLPEPFNGQASWRYTLMTGLLPAIPIALMLPFVPESQTWLERRRAGTLRRPSIGELFSPELRRVTIVTAILSACAYGAAFGALQLTPTRMAPGLTILAEHTKALKPLRDEALGLNKQLNEISPRFRQAVAEMPGLLEVSSQRAKARIALRATRKQLENPDASEPEKAELKTKLGNITNNLAKLDVKLDEVTRERPENKKVVLDREKILGQLGGNREKQEPHDVAVKAKGNEVQFYQETGGLIGRIALAALVVMAIPRRTLLRLFQVPGLVLFPLTYLFLFRNSPENFKWGMACCGFLTVAQFSYFGEYLPKAFPLHLRGTGGSFATNVGGRMIGTSAAYLTANIVAPRMSGNTFEQVATAAAMVGLGVVVIGLVASFWLPEPKADAGE